MTARSKKALKLARGASCTLRLVGVCNFNDETTVACHIGGIRGMGYKCGDNMVIYACSSCHDAIDGRASQSQEELAEDKLRALEETQEIMIKNGVMVLK